MTRYRLFRKLHELLSSWVSPELPILEKVVDSKVMCYSALQEKIH